MRLFRIGACGVALATLAIVVVDELALAPSQPHGTDRWVEPFVAAAALTPAGVGLLIAWRQPRNAVAWILLVGALASTNLSELIPDRGWSLQVGRSLWPLLFAWPVALSFVFPNGRLLSRRWRWPAIVGTVCFVAFMFEAAFDRSAFDPPAEAVPNPMAGVVFPHWLEWTWIPFWFGILASLIAGAIAIRLRWRGAQGIERLQMLWLAYAALLIPFGLFASILWHFFGLVSGWVIYAFLLLMEVTVAAAVGIAVARYRLYAIERLINRTLVYIAVTTLLGAAYVGVALGVGVAVGRGSDWTVAAATLVVATGFRPLRARVQGLVDGRFDRIRLDGVRLVAAFEHQLREGLRAPEEIGQVLADALRDPLAELVYWLPATESYASSSGELIRALVDDARARSEITRDGAPIAVLFHDPALLRRRATLRDVLAAGTLSTEIARLRVEVRVQLQEVQASRVRIVEAGYEERRRLERDLHDGAQQRLVSLGLQIRRMQRSLPREASILAPALDQIVDEIGSAISDLRQIAAGVRPTRLDDGLAAALHDLARMAPVPVEVDAPVGRVAASVEAAAYFVVCEALTNAVKHSSATRIALSAQTENGTLRLRVEDDGVGGARARRGSGLVGLNDRVSAHGGTVTIASPRGGGTRIEVAIPCDS